MSTLEELCDELEALRTELAGVSDHDHPASASHVHTQRCIPRHPREVAAQKHRIVQAITEKEDAAVRLAWRAEIDATVADLMKAAYDDQAKFSRKARFIFQVWVRWQVADFKRALREMGQELRSDICTLLRRKSAH